MQEKWEQLYEFPDYDISDLGQIRSRKTGRLMTPSGNGQGILKVVLTKDKETYTRSVAKLVATTFHGEPPPGNTVVHLDDDYMNVAAYNLEWAPRWFAQKWARQNKRTRPLRYGQIMMDSTGQIFENSLECAKAIRGIEEYIILCAVDPGNSRYKGSTYRWVM